ncbi:DUF4440 domain-containing protein [Paracoccus litorisediminis]|jgi:hypothetical protein|uniref:DUF4440 domain-containing protein n=1 Tax=Paracoccus litorisediminis TaxID=2006130 RepID=UPI0037324FC6
MALIDHGSALGQEILAFEAARQAALIAADPAALARILHDDLTHVHSSGQVHGKGEFIAHVGRMGGFVAITRGALELRSLGGGVLITGPSLNRVRRIDTGELVDLDGFSAIAAVQTTAGWQVLLSQMTLLRK